MSTPLNRYRPLVAHAIRVLESPSEEHLMAAFVEGAMTWPDLLPVFEALARQEKTLDETVKEHGFKGMYAAVLYAGRESIEKELRDGLRPIVLMEAHKDSGLELDAFLGLLGIDLPKEVENMKRVTENFKGEK